MTQTLDNHSCAEIPKRLFFIWLGGKAPSYAQYAIDAFKKMNPSFEVCFIRYSMDQLESICNGHVQSIEDKLLHESIHAILNDEPKYHDQLYRVIVDGQKVFYGNDIRFIQILGDIFRLQLVNEIGGIYLDCDAFPMKPFDDWLLQKKCFTVAKHHRIGTTSHVICDNYFIGCNGSSKMLHNNDASAFRLLQTTDNWWCSLKFIMNKKKFFDMSLKPGEKSLDGDFYIEHYCDGNWQSTSKGIRTPECFLDKLFRGRRR